MHSVIPLNSTDGWETVQTIQTENKQQNTMAKLFFSVIFFFKMHAMNIQYDISLTPGAQTGFCRKKYFAKSTKKKSGGVKKHFLQSVSSDDGSLTLRIQLQLRTKVLLRQMSSDAFYATHYVFTSQFQFQWSYKPPKVLKFTMLEHRFQKCKNHFCRPRGSGSICN